MPLDSDRIRKTSRKLRKFVRKAPKRPGPEEVHQLRTHIRRLEAAMHALRSEPTRRERRLMRDLGRIRKRAGKVRDMDVLTSDAMSVQVAGEKDCAVPLRHHLGARRYEHARRLRHEMERRGSRVRRPLKRLGKRLVKYVSEAGQGSGNGQPGTPAEAVATAVELAASLKSPPSLNQKNLHPYRLKVKELRDVLRLAEKPTDEKLIEALGGVKDAIGDWHDWQELTTIAGDLLIHGPGCKLLQRLKQTTNEKYEHALSLAIRMRKQFVGNGSKTARPALVASAAMAS